MNAITKTGYKGYVAQEFLPTGKTEKEKEKALEKAIRICDV
jgi:hydroxypyruvate isomerase